MVSQTKSAATERACSRTDGQDNAHLTAKRAVDLDAVAATCERLAQDRRSDAGIFYTPPVEIDLACRLALVDTLANHVGPHHKPLLYCWIFARGTAQKTQADQRVAAAGIRDPLDDLLRRIRIVDPACGSGSFLLGMLLILDDLRHRLNLLRGIRQSCVRRRREIIAANLYGVDVMDWACEAARKRLALAAMADETPSKLRGSELAFNLCCGDGLQRRAESPAHGPFAWNIAFPEIFGNGGFDIVIGNPPYVRQESIADPLLPRDRITSAAKKRYKDRLARAIYREYPAFFGDNRPAHAAPTLDAKSDLYIYFCFLGLSLLNPRGTFCFITSNSWLDVAYGGCLQEFLLRHTHIKMIIDNQARRSFPAADVNTVITLLSAPAGDTIATLSQTARFIMFKQPFEKVRSTALINIEKADARQTTLRYRVFALRQDRILHEGQSNPIGHAARAVPYRGDKWGGKYLRAPDIYWTLREKARSYLAPLASLARLRRGFTTGANDFFYISREKNRQWQIEHRFLRPVLKSPRQVQAIYVDPQRLDTFVFLCPEPMDRIHGTHALDYIQWGARQRTHGRQKQPAGMPWPEIPSLAVRDPWYALDLKAPGDFFCTRFFNDRFFFAYTDGVAADQTFYTGAFRRKNLPRDFCLAILNSSVVLLTAGLLGRVALGQGVLQYAVYEMENLLVLDPWSMPAETVKPMTAIFQSMCRRKILPIPEELTQPDRRALDDIIFDTLRLTRSQRADLYVAIELLVTNRLVKADSLTAKRSS